MSKSEDVVRGVSFVLGGIAFGLALNYIINKRPIGVKFLDHLMLDRTVTGSYTGKAHLLATVTAVLGGVLVVSPIFTKFEVGKKANRAQKRLRKGVRNTFGRIGRRLRRR